jgi:hypothetical protein
MHCYTVYTVDKSNITDTSIVKYCQFCGDPVEYIPNPDPT